MALHTRLLAATPDGIAAAAAILRAGGLVAMPTETVYGLAADARVDAAVAGIYAAKNRPSFNPLIVHLPDFAAAADYVHIPAMAAQLAATFCPGPLTLVLPLRAGHGLSPLVTAGLETVAIRVPDHPVARDLLRAFGGPVAAPSANPSGRVSSTTAAHVMDGLAGRIDAVIDDGRACGYGIESTIVGLDGPAPTLLRPGGIAVELIEGLLGRPLTMKAHAAKPNAPGQLASHYAPAASVRLNVTEPAVGEVWVGFGPDCTGAALNLSPKGNGLEAAHNLFAMLRAADQIAGPGGMIAFAPIPETFLGRAINDRLRRAAAPRDKA